MPTEHKLNRSSSVTSGTPKRISSLRLSSRRPSDSSSSSSDDFKSVYPDYGDYTKFKSDKNRVLFEMDRIQKLLPMDIQEDRSGQFEGFRKQIQGTEKIPDLVRYYELWSTTMVKIDLEMKVQSQMYTTRKVEIQKEVAKYFEKNLNLPYSTKTDLIDIKTKIINAKSEAEQEQHFKEWLDYTSDILSCDLQKLQKENDDLEEENFKLSNEIREKQEMKQRKEALKYFSISKSEGSEIKI